MKASASIRASIVPVQVIGSVQILVSEQVICQCPVDTLESQWVLSSMTLFKDTVPCDSWSERISNKQGIIAPVAKSGHCGYHFKQLYLCMGSIEKCAVGTLFHTSPSKIFFFKMGFFSPAIGSHC